MERLILVSNRLPVTVNKIGKEEFEFRQSTGGLATGLSSVYKNYEGFWMGWPGLTSDELSEKEQYKLKNQLQKEKNYPLFLSQKDLNNYYYGFCNKTLWPLFHYFTQYTRYPEKYWQAYKRVNLKFFRNLKDHLKEDDNIWIHDYHLMLLPEMIRREFPDVRIGYFLHIPFPSSEIFRLLPWKEEILKGLLGSDLIGFHTYSYVRHFLSSVLRILGYHKEFNEIKLENRTVKAELFPMGIDYKKYSQAPLTKEVKNEIKNIKKRSNSNQIILSVDRMDYTKGIPERLRGFDYFLENNPQYQGKVTMIVIAVPSRTKIEKYEELKIEVNELVGDINGKYGTLEWTPVWFLFKSVPFERLTALYNMADVCLVTPLRDGMNLVSKEFVAASHDKGVLVLSEMAGSSYELSKAINITPTRKEEIGESILEALEMNENEQKERLNLMKNRIKNYDVIKWANSFIEKLVTLEKEERAEKFDTEKKSKFLNTFENSSKRLIILDHNTFTKNNNSYFLPWIEKISSNPKNDLIIMSRKKPKTLEKIFSEIDCYLFAQYGKFYYDKNSWKQIDRKEATWKEYIEPIIEMHKENTPGALIENTTNSIRWNHKEAEPELSKIRKRELKENISYFSNDFNIDIVDGENFLEIKSSSTESYNTIYNLIQEEEYDFSLFLGNLSRYPDIHNFLTKKPYIFEVISQDINNSYKINEPKSLLKLLYSN